MPPSTYGNHKTSTSASRGTPSGTPNLACKAKMRRSAACGRGWVGTAAARHMAEQHVRTDSKDPFNVSVRCMRWSGKRDARQPLRRRPGADGWTGSTAHPSAAACAGRQVYSAIDRSCVHRANGRVDLGVAASGVWVASSVSV